jgi:UDP-N-acetylmuramate--alanine ligase
MQDMKKRVGRIHMIGIGGSGMSGIAEVLLNLDYQVSGSDLSDSAVVRRLKDLGASIARGHAEGNVTGSDVVVKSTAIKEDNPEVIEARELGVPVIPRAEMLAELMRLKSGIAVAGTHGKTTTTSLLATIFTEAGLDPTVIIGGILNIFGANARLGEGEFLIAEADESDGSFLCLSPVLTIVTNVDADHLDFYKDIDEIDDSFVEFMNSVPFYGKNVVCLDDAGIQRLLPRVNRPVLTYGFGKDCDVRGEIREGCTIGTFSVHVQGEFWGDVEVAQPGRHNMLNALAAIGVSLEAGLPKDKIIAALKNFKGVGRRFEIKGEREGVLVVDDYGHHPKEVQVTLETARECYPDKRLVVAFQPHRFSRTQALFGDFCSVFDKADLLLLTEIYPAGESPIPGVSGRSLAEGIGQVSGTKVMYMPDFKAVEEVLSDVLKPGDVFLTMGAGNIWTVGMHYLSGEGA